MANIRKDYENIEGFRLKIQHDYVSKLEEIKNELKTYDEILNAPIKMFVKKDKDENIIFEKIIESIDDDNFENIMNAFDKIENRTNTINENIIRIQNLKSDYDNQYTNEMDDFVQEIFTEFNLDENTKNIITSYLEEIKKHSPETYRHSVDVAIRSYEIGKEYVKSEKLTKEELKDICVASLVHDAGKKYVNKDILHKSGSLDNTEKKYLKIEKDNDISFVDIEKDSKYKDEAEQHKDKLLTELEVMQMHAELTEKFVKVFNNKNIERIAVHHHEKLNGLGYPNPNTEFEGDKIDLALRIISVADITSALIMERSYKDAKSPEKTAAILLTNVANNEIDKDVAFTQIKVLNNLYNFKEKDLNDQVIDETSFFEKSEKSKKLNFLELLTDKEKKAECIKVLNNVPNETKKLFAQLKEELGMYKSIE